MSGKDLYSWRAVSGSVAIAACLIWGSMSTSFIFGSSLDTCASCGTFEIRHQIVSALKFPAEKFRAAKFISRSSTSVVIKSLWIDIYMPTIHHKKPPPNVI